MLTITVTKRSAVSLFYVSSQIHLRHEESPSHVKSSLDVSYGKHWDEMNNKRTLLLSQSFKNQSTQNHTSYTLEVNTHGDTV